jgi:transcriptional regulator with XRE-family HTH domain
MSAHATKESYGRELRDIRKALGFDQDTMGGYLGVCRDTISRYERYANICPEPIIRLARLVYRQLGATQQRKE